jgi:hypothetical protein
MKHPAHPEPTMTTIAHNGLTFIADEIQTGVKGNRFRTLQKLGKSGKPTAQHFIATIKADGTIGTVSRWF